MYHVPSTKIRIVYTNDDDEKEPFSSKMCFRARKNSLFELKNLGKGEIVAHLLLLHYT